MNKSTKIILIGAAIALLFRLTNLSALAYAVLALVYWFALTKNWLRMVLRFIAVLLLLMALISNELSSSAHLVLGCALISFQMVLSLWFAIKAMHWIDGVVVVIEQIAGIGMLFGLANKNPYLVHFQLLFELCFIILLVRATNTPTDKKILSI